MHVRSLVRGAARPAGRQQLAAMLLPGSRVARLSGYARLTAGLDDADKEPYREKIDKLSGIGYPYPVEECMFVVSRADVILSAEFSVHVWGC